MTVCIGRENSTMCMIDDSDGRVIVLHEELRTARKTHRCYECGREIMPGERYHHEATLYEGRKDTVKTCRHCLVVRAWLQAECGGWLYGGISEDIQEHVDDSWNHYGHGVRMLAVGIRRRWKKRNGELWRVPSRPRTTHEILG